MDLYLQGFLIERTAGCNLTSPEAEVHPLTVSEMPEVNEGNPASSSASNAKDAKVRQTPVTQLFREIAVWLRLLIY